MSTKETSMEELRITFSQCIQSQRKSKSKHGEGSNRKRGHHIYSHFQIEERVCSNLCYNSYQLPCK